MADLSYAKVKRSKTVVFLFERIQADTKIVNNQNWEHGCNHLSQLWLSGVTFLRYNEYWASLLILFLFATRDCCNQDNVELIGFCFISHNGCRWPLLQIVFSLTLSAKFYCDVKLEYSYCTDALNGHHLLTRVSQIPKIFGPTVFFGST